MIVVNGIIFGLTLAIMLGPIFFTLVQTSLQQGFVKAILVAIGVSLGDLLYISFAYYGFDQINDWQKNEHLIGFAGAAILASFGVVAILNARNAARRMQAESIRGKGFFRFIFKGFLVNAISPFVPVFWIGTMSLAMVEYHYAGGELAAFFLTILLVVFVTDLLKAYLAARLSRLVTPRFIQILNIGVGVVLIVFALRMVVYSWQIYIH